MTNIELCVRMLQYSSFAKRTEDRRASEVKEALKFFFTDEELAEAVDIVTGRAKCP